MSKAFPWLSEDQKQELMAFPEINVDSLKPEVQKAYRKIKAAQAAIRAESEPEPPGINISPTGQAVRSLVRASPLRLLAEPSALETAANPNTLGSGVGRLSQGVSGNILTVVPSAVGGLLGIGAASAGLSMDQQAVERLQAERAKEQAAYGDMIAAKQKDLPVAEAALNYIPKTRGAALSRRISEEPGRFAMRTALDTGLGVVGAKIGFDIAKAPAAKRAFAAGAERAAREAAEAGAGVLGQAASRIGGGLTRMATSPAGRALPAGTAGGAAINAGQYLGQQTIEDRPISMGELALETALGTGIDIGAAGLLSRNRAAKAADGQAPKPADPESVELPSVEGVITEADIEAARQGQPGLQDKKDRMRDPNEPWPENALVGPPRYYRLKKGVAVFDDSKTPRLDPKIGEDGLPVRSSRQESEWAEIQKKLDAEAERIAKRDGVDVAAIRAEMDDAINSRTQAYVSKAFGNGPAPSNGYRAQELYAAKVVLDRFDKVRSGAAKQAPAQTDQTEAPPTVQPTTPEPEVPTAPQTDATTPEPPTAQEATTQPETPTDPEAAPQPQRDTTAEAEDTTDLASSDTDETTEVDVELVPANPNAVARVKQADAAKPATLPMLKAIEVQRVKTEKLRNMRMPEISDAKPEPPPVAKKVPALVDDSEPTTMISNDIAEGNSNVPAVSPAQIVDRRVRDNESRRSFLEPNAEEESLALLAFPEAARNRLRDDYKKNGVPERFTTESDETPRVKGLSDEEIEAAADADAEAIRLALIASTKNLFSQPTRVGGTQYDLIEGRGARVSATDQIPEFEFRKQMAQWESVTKLFGVVSPTDLGQMIEKYIDRKDYDKDTARLVFGAKSRSTKSMPSMQDVLNSKSFEDAVDLFDSWDGSFKSEEHSDLNGNPNWIAHIQSKVSEKIADIFGNKAKYDLADPDPKKRDSVEKTLMVWKTEQAEQFKSQIRRGLRDAEGNVIRYELGDPDGLVASSRDSWTDSQPPDVRRASDDFVRSVLDEEIRRARAVDASEKGVATVSPQDLKTAMSFNRGRMKLLAQYARKEFMDRQMADGGVAEDAARHTAAMQEEYNSLKRAFYKERRAVQDYKRARSEARKAKKIGNPAEYALRVAEARGIEKDYPGVARFVELEKALRNAQSAADAAIETGLVQPDLEAVLKKADADKVALEQKRSVLETQLKSAKKKVDKAKIEGEIAEVNRQIIDIKPAYELMKEYRKKQNKDPLVDASGDFYYMSPFETLTAPLFPENPRDMKPGKVWDGDVYDANDLRMEGTYNSNKTVLNVAEIPTANKFTSPLRVALMLNYLRRIVGDLDTVFPVIKKPNEFFDSKFGSIALGSYNSEEGRAYLNKLLDYHPSADKATFIVLHEMTHGLDKGRVMDFGPNGEAPSVYMGITGDADKKWYDKNNALVSKVNDEAILLAEEFDQPVNAKPQGRKMSEAEKEKADAYKDHRLRNRELTADAIAAVLQDPQKAMSIAPTVTKLVLDMLPKRHPNLAKALREFYTAKDLNAETQAMMSDKTRESIREFGDAEQARKDAEKPGFFTALGRDFISAETPIRAAFAKILGRQLNKQEAAAFETAAGRMTGKSQIETSLTRIMDEGRRKILDAGGTDEQINQYFLLLKKSTTPSTSDADAQAAFNDFVAKFPKVAKAAGELQAQIKEQMTGLINTMYRRGDLGNVGSPEAVARRDDWIANMWVAEGKAGPAEESRTGALKSEKEAVGSYDPKGDVLQNTLESAIRLSQLSNQTEFIRVVDRIVPGKMIKFGKEDGPDKVSKSAEFPQKIEGFVDGQVQQIGYGTNTLKFFVEQQQNSGANILNSVTDAATDLLKPGTNLYKSLATKVPWFQIRSLFREIVSTSAIKYLDDGIRPSFRFAGRFAKGAADLLFNGQGLPAQMSRALVKDGRAGLEKMLAARESNLARLQQQPSSPAIVEARKVLQDQIENIRDVLIGYDSGGFFEKGEGYQTGAPGEVRTSQQFARSRLLSLEPDKARLGEKAMRSEVGRQFGQIMGAYSNWLNSLEMLSKVASVQSKGEVMRARGVRPEQLREQMEARLRTLEAREDDYARAYANHQAAQNNNALKLTAKRAMDARDAARKLYFDARDLYNGYSEMVGRAAMQAGTPDTRVKARYGGALNVWMPWYSVAMKELQRSAIAVSEAWNSADPGDKNFAKARALSLLAVPVALDGVRRALQEAFFTEEERALYELAISPQRRQYSIDLPWGITRYIDEQGKQRVYAVGISLPIPDFFRPIISAYQGTKEAAYSETEGVLAKAIAGTRGGVGALADYVFPSINPLVDVAVAGGTALAGGDPKRGLNPLSSQKVVPGGSNVTEEERRAIVFDYVAQRTGLSQLLPRFSSDAPMSNLPGAMRGIVFVDDGGFTDLAIKAKDFQEKESRNRADQIRRGEYPADATRQEIERAMQPRSASPSIRAMNGVGPRGLEYVSRIAPPGSPESVAVLSRMTPNQQQSYFGAAGR